jgi:hypothetical protein
MVESPMDIQFEPRETIEDLTVHIDETGVGIRIERIEIDGTPFELQTDFIDLGEIKLNLHTLPRAYVVASTTETKGERPLKSYRCWTPADGVEIAQPTTGETWSAKISDGLVREIRREPETLVLETDTTEKGYLILSETYRPGWSAEVDGKERPVLRAQRAFRAVAVPAGRHQIVLAYRPTSLLVGALLSFLALLGLIVLARSKRGIPP